MNIEKIILFTCTVILSLNSLAQHEHHPMHTDTMPMTHSLSVHLPMSRNGSGTSWLPDSTPIYGYMKMLDKNSHGMTTLMVHGSLFARYTSQDISKKGQRGAEQFDAPNWIMLMLQHNHRKSVFAVHTMFSLDWFTEGGDGYPLLFQTGETFEGKRLVDRQHPHDLFSELAVSYAYAINTQTDVYVYLGYPESLHSAQAFLCTVFLPSIIPMHP